MLNKTPGSDLKAHMEGFSVLWWAFSTRWSRGLLHDVQFASSSRSASHWQINYPQAPLTWKTQLRPDKGIISLLNEPTDDPAFSGCDLFTKGLERRLYFETRSLNFHIWMRRHPHASRVPFTRLLSIVWIAELIITV